MSSSADPQAARLTIDDPDRDLDRVSTALRLVYAISDPTCASEPVHGLDRTMTSSTTRSADSATRSTFSGSKVKSAWRLPNRIGGEKVTAGTRSLARACRHRPTADALPATEVPPELTAGAGDHRFR